MGVWPEHPISGLCVLVLLVFAPVFSLRVLVFDFSWPPCGHKGWDGAKPVARRGYYREIVAKSGYGHNLSRFGQNFLIGRPSC
jgi:hypothetical protein